LVFVRINIWVLTQQNFTSAVHTWPALATLVDRERGDRRERHRTNRGNSAVKLGHHRSVAYSV